MSTEGIEKKSLKWVGLEPAMVCSAVERYTIGGEYLKLPGPKKYRSVKSIDCLMYSGIYALSWWE